MDLIRLCRLELFMKTMKGATLPIKQIVQEKHDFHGTQSFNFATYDMYVDPGFHFLYSHWHREYEVIYVEYGTLTFELNGQPIQLSENQSLFINRYQIHACYCTAEQPSHYTCILFGEQFLCPDVKSLIYQKYFLQINQGALVPPKIISGKYDWEHTALNTIKLICKQAIDKEQGYELSAQLHLLRLFHLFHLNNAFIKDTEQISREKIGFVNEAINLIQSHYQSQIKISDLADKLNICTEHLIRSFKNHTGKTPKEYLLKYRIDHAMSLLVSTNLSVSEIATQSGFFDMSYFSKYFKKYNGCTPVQFRKNHMKA